MANTNILYVETYVNGVKVNSVKTGDVVEYRVVFDTLAGSVEIYVKRPNEPSISTGRMTVNQGTYYVGFNWTETYSAGTYNITCSSYFNQEYSDSKWFPYIVTSPNGGGGDGGDGGNGGGETVGIVRGEIKNSKTNAPVSGATVSFTSLNKSTTTNSTGVYSFPNIPIGKQNVTVTATKYTTYSGTITVTEGDTNYNKIPSIVPINGNGGNGGGDNWWDKIPGGWYTIAGAGSLVGILAIIGVIYQQEQQRNLMMMLFGIGRR